MVKKGFSVAMTRSKPASADSAQVRFGSPDPETVDLRPLKAAVEALAPSHPARRVILAEPDLVGREAYAAKAVVWFRLLRWADR